MIEFKDDTYYAGIWYCEIPEGLPGTPGNGGNFMGVLYREDSHPQTWHYHWRMRYYNDDVAFDSDDIKSWHRQSRDDNADEDKAIADTMKIIGLICKVGWSEMEVVLLKCRGSEVVKKLLIARPSWMHIKMIDSEEEAEAAGVGDKWREKMGQEEPPDPAQARKHLEWMKKRVHDAKRLG